MPLSHAPTTTPTIVTLTYRTAWWSSRVTPPPPSLASPPSLVARSYTTTTNTITTTPIPHTRSPSSSRPRPPTYPLRRLFSRHRRPSHTLRRSSCLHRRPFFLHRQLSYRHKPPSFNRPSTTPATHSLALIHRTHRHFPPSINIIPLSPPPALASRPFRASTPPPSLPPTAAAARRLHYPQHHTRGEISLATAHYRDWHLKFTRLCTIRRPDRNHTQPRTLSSSSSNSSSPPLDTHTNTHNLI